MSRASRVEAVLRWSPGEHGRKDNARAALETMDDAELQRLHDGLETIRLGGTGLLAASLPGLEAAFAEADASVAAAAEAAASKLRVVRTRIAARMAARLAAADPVQAR